MGQVHTYRYIIYLIGISQYIHIDTVSQSLCKICQRTPFISALPPDRTPRIDMTCSMACSILFASVGKVSRPHSQAVQCICSRRLYAVVKPTAILVREPFVSWRSGCVFTSLSFKTTYLLLSWRWLQVELEVIFRTNWPRSHSGGSISSGGWFLRLCHIEELISP